MESQTWRNEDERRYELEREVAEQVLVQLETHLPVLIYNSGPATSLVATAYFDTPDRKYLNLAKAGGTVSSIKVRAREYFPISDDEERRVLNQYSHCYLERKERTGTIRNKDRVRIDKSDLNPIIRHEKHVPGASQILSDEIRTNSLAPALVSMYERRVWGDGSDLRITLDERIRYYQPPIRMYDDISAMTPSELGWAIAPGPKRILEVKHAAEVPVPTWLSTVLAELPEATGFSKYLDGMKALDAGGHEGINLTRPLYKLP